MWRKTRSVIASSIGHVRRLVRRKRLRVILIHRWLLARRPLLIAFYLTLGWIFIGGLIGFMARVEDHSKCAVSFGCLTANEWGDYIAGMSAPIAFLWLVAAVLIQSDELRLQRKELAATRQEMRDNRTVSQEQAREAHRQAEFVGTQTSILKQNQTDDELRAFLGVFQNWILHNFRLMKPQNEGYQVGVRDIGYLTASTPDDPVRFFIAVCGRLEAAVNDKLHFGGSKEWVKFTSTTGSERFLINSFLQKVSSYGGRVSPSLQMVLTTTNVLNLTSKLIETGAAMAITEEDNQAITP